ncbi:MAG TPA: hypothetical protein VEF34_19050, partial [Syntrophobacteraceae bacterium]|nr:hypothetical protein [Syntrophobacteraceae bacterium]
TSRMDSYPKQRPEVIRMRLARSLRMPLAVMVILGTLFNWVPMMFWTGSTSKGAGVQVVLS